MGIGALASQVVQRHVSSAPSASTETTSTPETDDEEEKPATRTHPQGTRSFDPAATEQQATTETAFDPASPAVGALEPHAGTGPLQSSRPSHPFPPTQTGDGESTVAGEPSDSQTHTTVVEAEPARERTEPSKERPSGSALAETTETDWGRAAAPWVPPRFGRLGDGSDPEHQTADAPVDPHIDEIKALADAEPFEHLTNAIAPKVYGYEHIKEAIILQLFGGVRAEYPDGSADRGSIHVLLLGDPGVAKSVLLRAADALAPRSTFASGKGTSAAGLTAGVVADDFGGERYSLKAGALVTANEGVACIDELDKVDEETRSSLHTALEQQIVEVNKIMEASMPARTSLLAAGNPEYGRFDLAQPIADPTPSQTADLMTHLEDGTLHIRLNATRGEEGGQFADFQSVKGSVLKPGGEQYEWTMPWKWALLPERDELDRDPDAEADSFWTTADASNENADDFRKQY